MFVGRDRELETLEEAYGSRSSQLAVIYGRRRIGKSSLVSRFAEGKPQFLWFEGIEGDQTPQQIRHFTESLRKQTADPLLRDIGFKAWDQVFSYLTERVVSPARGKPKLILFFDEIPWMAAGRGRLISLLKYYWDNHWKPNNVMLILCGSVASFMVKRVIRSQALYGRITQEILLRGLEPNEAARLFRQKRSSEEILKYLLVFGGVPKYLEEVRLDRSFAQNMNRLCFSPSSPLAREVQRIFYSQFRESETYARIVMLLRDATCTFDEISRRLGIRSGGGLKLYLQNLQDAEIIRSFVPFNRGPRSKLRKYGLADEFLHFYFRFVEPNVTTIAESRSGRLFERFTRDAFHPWLGFAFERFCVKHAAHLAYVMGFDQDVLTASPYFEKGTEGYQIDLVYRRSDKVITICEVKYHDRPVGTKVIPEVERKCSLLPLPRGHTCEKALISLHGPDRALHDSEYFDHFVVLSDIFEAGPESQRR
jgi:AAA+ ATPase superfamily predicted ATPase